MIEHVGILWYDSRDGVTWSGRITLPRPLPAGVGLQVVAVPKPIRGKTREKYDLHIEIPLPEAPPAPPGPDDIRFKGELMSQWFAPPEPTNRRSKILIWGDSGSGKTKAALSFPACAYMDNHGSAEKYRVAYPHHRFFPPRPDVFPTPDNVMGAITTLLGDPGDRLTLVLDDITTFWDQVQAKWSNLFLTRLPQSKGHHAEFYSFQPSDWIHPKRELRAMLRRTMAIDMSSIATARSQPKYAGKGQNFMEVVGQIFAGEKGIVYEYDYIFEFIVEANIRYAVVHKQRITPGDKPFPDKFEHHIDGQGFSDFYNIFSQYVDPGRLNAPSHAVADPESIPEPAAYQQVAQTVAGNPVQTAEPAPPPAAAVEAAPPTPPGDHPMAAMITREQLDRLAALKAEYKIENPEWGQTLEKFYGVKTARALTQPQADHLIQYLTTQRVPF
ncbi:MAG: AAA family ATPase [Thermodesulfobacteriota bacterium]|nr:AAA family ATPase [Thermodesulfobacteriota bacterium]